MKFNPSVLLAGGCIAGLLAITPFIAQANSVGSRTQTAQAPQVAPASSQIASADRTPLGEISDQLDLTADQQAQIANLRRNTRTQIQSILQPNQRQQFLTAWQQGSSFRDSVAAMNVTAEQRQQLREVAQSTRSQARALLTDAQRQELRQLIQDRLDAVL